MLYKSINFNLQIGYKSFFPAIAIAVVTSVITLMTMSSAPMNMFILMIGLMISCIFSYKGLNYLFNTSLFNEGSSFYMTLPMAEKDIVWGKIISASIYLGIYLVVFLVPMMFSLLYIGNDMGFSNFSMLISDNFGMVETLPPALFALYTASMPIQCLIGSMTSCAFLLALMLYFHSYGTGQNGQKNKSAYAWIIFFAGNGTYNKLWETLSGKTGGSLYIQLVQFIINIALLFAFASYCTKNLQNQYNQ